MAQTSEVYLCTTSPNVNNRYYKNRAFNGTTQQGTTTVVESYNANYGKNGSSCQ